MQGSFILFLVSAAKQEEGFWKIGLTKHLDPLKTNPSFIECYRKELIGAVAGQEIKHAIEQNIGNLLEELTHDGYEISKPKQGISYDLPLTVLEEIYDFWLNLYKEKCLFEKVVTLLATRKKINFGNPAIVKGLKGFTAEWSQKVEKLHSYRPPSPRVTISKEPMWIDKKYSL